MNEALQAIMSMLQNYGQQGEGDLPWGAAGGGIPGGVLPGGQWPAQGGQPQQGPGPGSYDDQTIGMLFDMLVEMMRQQYPPGAFSYNSFGDEHSPFNQPGRAQHPMGDIEFQQAVYAPSQLGPGRIGPLQQGAPPLPYNPTPPWQQSYKYHNFSPELVESLEARDRGRGY